MNGEWIATADDWRSAVVELLEAVNDEKQDVDREAEAWDELERLVAKAKTEIKR